MSVTVVCASGNKIVWCYIKVKFLIEFGIMFLGYVLELVNFVIFTYSERF